MHKTAATMVTIAALSTAAAGAYGCMKPAAKQQLKRDMRNAAKDVESVKDEMLNVGQDVTDMAKNIKNQMM